MTRVGNLNCIGRRRHSKNTFWLQNKPHVEHYVHQDGAKSRLSETEGLQDSIIFTSIGCQLPLCEIYDKVRSSRSG